MCQSGVSSIWFRHFFSVPTGGVAGEVPGEARQELEDEEAGGEGQPADPEGECGAVEQPCAG